MPNENQDPNIDVANILLSLKNPPTSKAQHALEPTPPDLYALAPLPPDLYALAPLPPDLCASASLPPDLCASTSFPPDLFASAFFPPDLSASTPKTQHPSAPTPKGKLATAPTPDGPFILITDRNDLKKYRHMDGTEIGADETVVEKKSNRIRYIVQDGTLVEQLITYEHLRKNKKKLAQKAYYDFYENIQKLSPYYFPPNLPLAHPKASEGLVQLTQKRIKTNPQPQATFDIGSLIKNGVFQNGMHTATSPEQTVALSSAQQGR